MNKDLLRTMANDMQIPCYLNESAESYIYRILYSALGLWCLHIAQNTIDSVAGTTKHNQTIVMNELLLRYGELCPEVIHRFIDTYNQTQTAPITIRRVYEETGYLVTDSNNRNILANYGRTIRLGDEFLFFGLPEEVRCMNGLGVYADPTDYQVIPSEFLIRDDLNCIEYFKAQFDPIDFYDKDIDLKELEIFNPLSNNAPSSSWCTSMNTDCTIARAPDIRTYYKIMRTPDGILFADESVERQTEAFTSYEYRRLYFALKHYYGNPLIASATKLDEIYSKIQLKGHLPNREYYFMLLVAWPERSIFDKVNFIIRNDLLTEVIEVLGNIGLEIRRG